MFVVEKRLSAKTKKAYVCLVHVVDKKEVVITCDKVIIIKVLNYTFDELDSLDVGARIEV